MESLMANLSSQGTLGQLLQQAHAFWTGLPNLPILVGHCLFCTTLAPEAKGHFLLHFWLTYLGGFAGGPLSALLIMNPAKAPISLMVSNRTGITWTFCWWLMTYSPLAPLLNSIYNIKPVKGLSKVCVSYMRATLIIARVTLAAALHPGVYLAPILAATVASCGGKSTYDAIRHLYGFSAGPAEFTVPTYSFRSAFLGSCLFYFSSICSQTRFFSPEQGAGALITLFVGQALFAEVTGSSLDWSEIVLRVVLRLGNIPWPQGVPSAMPAATSSKPAKTTAATTTTVAAKHSDRHTNGVANTHSNGTTDTDAANGYMRSFPLHVSDGGHSPSGSSVDGDIAEGTNTKGATTNATAPVPPKVLDVETIKAALQQSANAGAGNKTQSKPKQANGGWQVVEHKKKAVSKEKVKTK